MAHLGIAVVHCGDDTVGTMKVVAIARQIHGAKVGMTQLLFNLEAVFKYLGAHAGASSADGLRRNASITINNFTSRFDIPGKIFDSLILLYEKVLLLCVKSLLCCISLCTHLLQKTSRRTSAKGGLDRWLTGSVPGREFIWSWLLAFPGDS